MPKKRGAKWLSYGKDTPRADLLERFNKNCSQRGARIFGFWRGFGEGASLSSRAVTEPKRSQKPKRPLFQLLIQAISPRGYSFFSNALYLLGLAVWLAATLACFASDHTPPQTWSLSSPDGQN